MDEIEKKAREMLAAECEASGFRELAADLREEFELGGMPGAALRAIAAALEAAREDGWQPIETAPRDGSLFLGCMDHSYHPQEACWAAYHPNAKGKECWRTAPICGNKIEGLTHWRPLPASPAIDQARGKAGGEVEGG